jgi:heme-degrading monooxygenase HmoA
MASVVRRSRVEDYGRWKTVYQAGEAARQAAGWRDLQVFRNSDDPNEIVILTEVDDLERARAYAESEEVRRRQRASGLLETTYYYPEA